MNSQVAKSQESKKVFLPPGGFHFGDHSTVIKTLLGSCVAITLWHPLLMVGGMCHYMLPKRRGLDKNGYESDGRYADAAMALFMRELARTGSHPWEYEVKMFGGGNQFPGHTGCDLLRVSDHNIDAGRDLLARYGFSIKAEHLGGVGHRSVTFDVSNGKTWIKFDGLTGR
ncbi:MAG: chemotaxis protein CheD [Methylomonas sp.]|nr:chemotaxis protein CheD [Methylomonas sp.]